MASPESLSARRSLAALAIERRSQGLARAFGISIPPKSRRSYPDPEHRQADEDERVAAILTSVLRAKDAKAPELKDLPQGQINETVTTYSEDQKGNVNVEHHTQPL